MSFIQIKTKTKNKFLFSTELSALFSIVINLLIILLSCFGIFAIIKDNFLLIIIFATVNTITLLISLWSTTAKAAIIFLQIAVSLFAFSYTLIIYWKMKIEIKRRKKLSKEAKNNKKNNSIQNHNHQNNNHENNNIKAIIVWIFEFSQWLEFNSFYMNFFNEIFSWKRL